ncbi:MAG TPA: mechanosensitive ion channel family protein [Methanomassiliicoccales archaeon]|nr:mechanosensitive ion channel family protein [Methanomassiliicoccales archaeon]
MTTWGWLLPLATDYQWLADWGWAVLLFVGLLVVALYLWSYITKNLIKLKTKEAGYLDADVASFLGRMVQAVLVIMIVFVGLYVLAQVSDWFDTEIWQKYLDSIVKVISIFLVLLVAMLLVRVLRRISRMARASSPEAHGFRGSTVEFTSLLVSYIIYIAAAVIVLVILLSFVHGIEPSTVLNDFLNQNGTKIGTAVVFMVAIVAVAKLASAIFEDYKFRTKKFNPQVVDMISDLVRYVLYIIAFLVGIFMLFSIIGFESVGFLLVVLTLMFIFLGIAMSYGTIRNVVSGLALMNTDPFEVGDRVRLGDAFVCEVVEKNLVFTRVRTEEGETVEVPNSEILGGRILNYRRSGVHGVSISLTVPATISHEEIETVVNRALSRIEGITKDPKPELYARDFKGERIAYEMVVYVLDPLRAKRTKSDIIMHIQDEFMSTGRYILSE